MMEGDLSLSQSLGGLRIANPDESPSLYQTESNSSANTAARASTTQTNIRPPTTPTHHLPEITSDHPDRPLSYLNFDPSSYKSEDYVFSSSPPALSPLPVASRHVSTRQAGPDGPLESPSHLHQHRSQHSQGYVQPQWQQPAIRQPQQPTFGQISLGSPLPAADPSYRLHRESSQTSMNGTSKRNGSRVSGMAMQAGVPTSEEGYNDRTYRSVQHTSGNTPYPPRRSSNNMPGGSAYQGNGHPLTPAQIYSNPNSRSNSNDWHERGAAVATRPELDANGNPILDANGQPVLRTHKKGVQDFQFGRTLGEGSYSTVLLAKDRQTGHEYAVKVLDKRHIIKEKKVKYVNIEKDTLNRLNNHPGVVRLYYTFQDERSLYFVLDFASAGELLGVLKRMTTFDEECTRFYGAQVLDTIEYMHSRGVIHRDLKPENILLDSHMHTKITDFGTAKILDPPPRSRANSNIVPVPDSMATNGPDRAMSFVGTAEYVSPELLTDKNAGKPTDLWAFGCIIYQLLAGRPPFKAANEYLTFQKIISLEYNFPQGFPPVARDLVERLLVLEPSRRLTIDHIKNHEFFHGIKWGKGLWDQKPPKLRSFVPIPTIQNLNTLSSSHLPEVGSSKASEVIPSHSTRPAHITIGNVSVTPQRPSPRLITELPPPSQLDIEWSPILTQNNERILKVGQQVVFSSSIISTPGSTKGEKGSNGNSLARFFGAGNNSRKRQRLVMVTSGGRVLIAASDGQEKKAKYEISLTAPGCSWRKEQDAKGMSCWIIDTKDKHFSFEDPKFSTPDAISTAAATDKWLECLEKAKDLAISQSVTNSFSDESRGFPSVMSSSTNTLDIGAQMRAEASSSRHSLAINGIENNTEELRGFRRFSKRQSKSGLAAVF